MTKEQKKQNNDDAIIAAFDDNPMLMSLDIIIPDINGYPRGKRISRDEIEKFSTKGVLMPGSLFWLNHAGWNTDDVFGNIDGDPDYSFKAIPGTLTPIPWADVPRMQCMAAITVPDAPVAQGDPRMCAQKTIDDLHAMGIFPVVALELEFYLLDIRSVRKGKPKAALYPNGFNPTVGQCHDLLDIDLYADFFQDLLESCQEMSIPATTSCSECGLNQFEVNLKHRTDPLQAADDMMMLKRVIRSIAQQHDMVACFMAKPWADQLGSGMHIHCSLLDETGNNIFASDSDVAQYKVGTKLRHAIGGLQATAAETMAILAANANSYRRLTPGGFAPINLSWGINNRSLAFRIPSEGGEGTRFEHRLAGADVNPYLLLAAVLIGVKTGIEKQIEPDTMIDVGIDVSLNPPKEGHDILPFEWNASLQLFRNSSLLRKSLGDIFVDTYYTVRYSEWREYSAQVPIIDFDNYLRTV